MYMAGVSGEWFLKCGFIEKPMGFPHLGFFSCLQSLLLPSPEPYLLKGTSYRCPVMLEKARSALTEVVGSHSPSPCACGFIRGRQAESGRHASSSLPVGCHRTHNELFKLWIFLFLHCKTKEIRLVANVVTSSPSMLHEFQ